MFANGPDFRAIRSCYGNVGRRGNREGCRAHVVDERINVALYVDGIVCASWQRFGNSPIVRFCVVGCAGCDLL